MNEPEPQHPQPSFTTLSSIAVVIGIVVGIGIFRLPPIIASNSSGEVQFLLFWIAGGVISLMGALCYAELSSSMPNAGGEYYFVRKGFGQVTGFFLSWGRMTVIQVGSIALIAFILGDYATILLDLGPYSSSIYAGATVFILTALNIMGTSHSTRTQSTLTALILLALLGIIIAGFFNPSADAFSLSVSKTDTGSLSGGSAGLAMIFVLITYGGWSEAAYLTGELENARKAIVRVLVLSIITITVLYLLVNMSYIHVLGFDSLRESETVAFDLTERMFGPAGSLVVALIVVVSAISTANATIITGARTNYAVGRDFRLFRFMGNWNKSRNSPVNALLTQGAMALFLVGVGAFSKQAIETIVDFTAPVFWFFILLTTLSLFVFRFRNEMPPTAYRIPFYPLPPLLFLLACGYMLYSSLIYTGKGALVGVAILLTGVPVWFFISRYQKKSITGANQTATSDARQGKLLPG
jgi:basic amino acid/polyamine antiporter, APA family